MNECTVDEENEKMTVEMGRKVGDRERDLLYYHDWGSPAQC